MAYLKEDFMAALTAAIQARPAAASYFNAGDPRMLAQIEAVATMFAMKSAQIDVAEVEPFVKARPGTIMADAALKGILPLAKPARVQILVSNPGATPVSVEAGRGVIDKQGRRFSVEAGTLVPAAGSAFIQAVQVTRRVLTHTVVGSTPFYSVEVPEPADQVFFAGVDVAIGSDQFVYTPEFCNTLPGSKVFHAETDEFRRLFIRFGATNVGGTAIGYQPQDGEIITLTVSECSGKVDLLVGDSFVFEYMALASEQHVNLSIDSVLDTGASPPDTSALAAFSRYPAIYDNNAVFLGNFDFLLRKKLSNILFLSVWNEWVEEIARGAPNVQNINCLFVSVSIAGQAPSVTQAAVSAIVAAADDSLRVVFVDPSERIIPISITAKVAAIHDPADVEAQIRTIVTDMYGRGTARAAMPQSSGFSSRDIQDAILAKVPAFSDKLSDLRVSIDEAEQFLPEHWRYATNGQLTVDVRRHSGTTGLWAA